MGMLRNVRFTRTIAVLILFCLVCKHTSTATGYGTDTPGPEGRIGIITGPVARGTSKEGIYNETIAETGTTASGSEAESTTIGMLNRWVEGINPWTDAPDCCIGFEYKDCTKECDMVTHPCDLECGFLIWPKTPTQGEKLTTQLQGKTGYRVTLTVPMESLKLGDNIYVSNKEGGEPEETITCGSFTPDQTSIYLVSDANTFFVTYESTSPEVVGCGGDEVGNDPAQFDTIKKVECNSEISEDENGDLYGDIVSPGYPFSPYPPLRDCTWTIKTPSPGYGIELQVKEFDLDASNGDFIRVNAGPMSTRSRGYLLTWSDTKTHVFKIMSGGSATVYFHSGLNAASTGRKGFHIIYKHLGNGSLPATTTTPGPELPTPPAGYNANYTLYAAGKTPEELDHDKNAFKESLMAIANKYCQVQHIYLTDPISLQDVIIHSISHCPPTWPYSQTCAEVTIQIAAKTVNGDYELTDINIQKMWDQYGWDRNVTRTGITPYERNPGIVIWWLIGAVAVLVIFIVILLIAWYFQSNPHHSRTKQQENKTTATDEKTGDVHTSGYNKAPFIEIENDDEIDDDDASYTSDQWDSYYDDGSTTYSNYNDSTISMGKINPAYINEDGEALYEINLGAEDFKFQFVDNGINKRSGNNPHASAPEGILKMQTNAQGENSETKI